MNQRRQFFRYLPPYPGVEDWGARVLDGGCTVVAPGSEYPAPGHPDDHHFSWEHGRRLNAYTFVYITSGQGVFDSEASGASAVGAGSLFIVFPGVWHRYRPTPETGWTEYWVECDGEQMEAAVQRVGLRPENPVLKLGHDDAFLRCFLNILDTLEAEPPGFQAVVGLESLVIVARIRSLLQAQQENDLTSEEKMMRQSLVRMREALGTAIDWEILARELGVSYSSFRRMFRKVTGRSPGDYFIEMKINRARQLLESPGKSIQEIADVLGFESVYYFSRLFKARVGMAPTLFRERAGDRPTEMAGP